MTVFEAPLADVLDPARLTALEAYGILDTAPEKSFDEVVLIQAKLDELTRSSAAQNRYIGIGMLTEEELDELRQRCATRARAERLDDAREAADAAEARAHEKAARAAERMG